MGIFPQERFKWLRTPIEKNNSIADIKLKAIVKITHVKRQITDAAKQKGENINLFFDRKIKFISAVVLA